MGRMLCASTLSLGTTEAHPQDTTPRVLFTMGFAELLLSTW